MVPVSAGAAVSVTATASSASYKLGTWTPFSLTFKTAAECVTLTPVSATATPAPTNCVDGNGSITFGATAGVVYTVDGIAGQFLPGQTLNNLEADTYTVRASAAPGYVLTGPAALEREVEFEFEDCPELPDLGTASVAFDWTAPTCDVAGTVTVNNDRSSNASLVAPSLSETRPAGTFVFEAGPKSQFNAAEPPVFVSPEGAPTIKSAVISENKKFLTVVVDIPAKLTGVLCGDLTTKPLTEGMVTWKQPDCFGNPGSYTLSNEPGIVWTVDGVVVEGNKTYTAAAGSTPTIVASLSDSTEYGFKPGQQTVWDLSFVAPTTCDLTTLALTGASNALGGLGMVAVLIMMAGTGLVVARRREAARIQG